MKVKIGDTVYDSQKTAILLTLDDEEKMQISMMATDDYRFCRFPMDSHIQDLVDFMKGE